MNLFLILDLIALQVGIILTVIVFLRKPPKLLWPSLIFVPIGCAIWSFGELMAQFVKISPEVYEIWIIVLYTGTTLLTVSWLHFILSFAKYININLPFDTPNLRKITVLISLVIWIVIISNHWHGLFIIPNMNSRNDYLVFWQVIASYHYGIYLFCFLVLVHLYKIVKEKAHLIQIRIVLTATVLPLTLNALYMFELVFENIDLTVIGFSLSNLLFVIAIYRYGLFSLSPFTLRSLIYSESDPYLILDPNGCVAVYSGISLEWFGKERLHVGCNGIELLAERFNLEDFIEGKASLHHLILNKTASFQVKTLDARHPEWFHITSTVVKNDENETLGIGVRLRNVTELENRNEKITEQSEVLEVILRSVDEGIVVSNVDGDIIYHNKRYLDVWDIDPISISGKFEAAIETSKKVFSSDDFMEELTKLRSSNEIERDKIIKLLDGRTLERNSLPIKLGSHVKGRLWITKDITEQLAAENLKQSVERKSFQAEKLSSLGIMAGGMAHEFNGLLTIILGRAELALFDLQKMHMSTDNVSAIIASGNRAAELTGQMLSYVGQNITKTERVRLQSVVEDTLEMLETTFTLGMLINLSFKADPVINGDRVQLGRVITSLIRNSTEALAEGKGQVDITLGETRDTPFDHNDLDEKRFAVLTVKDDGRGIPEELIDRIFDPFVTSKFTGRGLGLAVAQGIVKGHRGILKVKSKLNGGTTFSMYLPIPEDEQ